MLNEFNEALFNGGGEWLKLTQKGQKVSGALVDAEIRDKYFNGNPVLSSKGKQRKEWVLTLDVNGEQKKVVAAEGGQIALSKAAQTFGRNLTKGDIVSIEVTESSVQGQKGAEWAVVISEGTSAPVSVASDDVPPPF